MSHGSIAYHCRLRSRIVNFNGSHGGSAPLQRFGPKWRIRAREQDGSRGASQLVRHLSWIVPLLLLGTVWAQEPSQPQIVQAQEKLRSLGFEVGETAGVLDPRTAKALEAFQRTRRLPVTGELDTATLRALGVVPGTEGAREDSISGDEAASSPWRPVLEYLRFFDSQPARLLLHVTPGFREDLTAAAWVAKVMTDPGHQKPPSHRLADRKGRHTAQHRHRARALQGAHGWRATVATRSVFRSCARLTPSGLSTPGTPPMPASKVVSPPHWLPVPRPMRAFSCANRSCACVSCPPARARSISASTDSSTCPTSP